MINIPTSISPRELDVMLRLARGKRVVEFGALLGFSTISMAKVASKVISIDKHEHYGPSTLNQFGSNLDAFGVKGKVEVRIVDVEASDHVFGDVGFIDLNGTLKTTLQAIEKCRCPVIMIHDLNRTGCAGVEEAIKKAGLHICKHVDSLAVCTSYESRDYYSACLRRQGW